MQYALVNDKKSLPIADVNAFCPCCNTPVIAKLGNIYVHHWAHSSLNDCPNNKPETEWHINWKNMFPEEYREVPSNTTVGGEIYFSYGEIPMCFSFDTLGLGINDIKTRESAIEFQNSPIKLEEIAQRQLQATKNNIKINWVFNKETYCGFNIKTNIKNKKYWSWSNIPYSVLFALEYSDVYMDIGGRWLYKITSFKLKDNTIKSYIGVGKFTLKDDFVKSFF
jgi:competence CoiA-like predicted nuclease